MSQDMTESSRNSRWSQIRDLWTLQFVSETYSSMHTHELTHEWLHTAVDVLVLLETWGCGEGLATLRAGVGTGTYMLWANVALQVAGVCEYLQETKKHKPGYTHWQSCAKQEKGILQRHSPVHWRLKPVNLRYLFIRPIFLFIRPFY